MFGPSRDDDDIARGKFELVLTFDRETRLASAEHITPEVGAARLMQQPGVWPAHSHHLDLIEPQVAQQRIMTSFTTKFPPLRTAPVGMTGFRWNYWAVYRKSVV